MRLYRENLPICVCASFPFGFEGGMWELIVLFPDQCLSFNFPSWNRFCLFTLLGVSCLNFACTFSSHSHSGDYFLLHAVFHTLCLSGRLFSWPSIPIFWVRPLFNALFNWYVIKTNCDCPSQLLKVFFVNKNTKQSVRDFLKKRSATASEFGWYWVVSGLRYMQ